MTKKHAIQYSVIVCGVVVVVALYKHYNPVGVLFPKCPVYYSLGFYCPGCGSQRAMHSLLNFNFLQAFSYNLLATLFVFAVVLDVIFRIIGWHRYRPYRLIQENRYASRIILLVIILFTIIRNIPISPFSWFAP